LWYHWAVIPFRMSRRRKKASLEQSKIRYLAISTPDVLIASYTTFRSPLQLVLFRMSTCWCKFNDVETLLLRTESISCCLDACVTYMIRDSISLLKSYLLCLRCAATLNAIYISRCTNFTSNLETLAHQQNVKCFMLQHVFLATSLRILLSSLHFSTTSN